MARFSALSALVALLAALPTAAPTPVSGYVLEAGTNEPLPGASVSAGDARTVTNAHGFFALTETDADTLVVRYVGFETFRQRLGSLRSEARGGAVTVRLTPDPRSLASAEVTARAETQAVMGSHVIPVEVAERLPAALGEVDVVRVQQLLPGVRGGTEGTSGLYVRGGSPDQTLTLLDGATVYNAAHLFGFFSTFNPAAVKRVELIKGSLPARFGGRLASVLDVQMREGDAGGLSGEAAVGLVASHVAVEGPLGRRATFAVSARRTYVDLILRPFQPDTVQSGYAFWDVNAKGAWNASPRDRLLVGVYTGRDAFTGRYRSGLSHSSERLAWGNATATARWTRRVGDRAFAETTVLASRYGLGVRSAYGEEGGADYRADYRSGLLDVGGSVRLEVAGPQVSATRVGVELMRHGYRPGATVTRGTGEPATVGASDRRQTTEGAAYVELEGRPVSALLVNAGVRATGLQTGGKTFGAIEPRLAARLALTPRLSASASFAAATQYVHLLANSGLGLPTDLWLPATPVVGPERGWQAALGLSADVGRGVDVSAEAYERRMSGLLEYRDGAGFFNTAFANWETQVVRGEGRARGVEVLVRKTAGRTTGWIAYTLARTDRRFDDFDGGAWYPYRFDRRHDIAVVASRRMSARTDLSATWVYGTGDALTLPVARAPAFTADDPSGGDGAETDVLSSRGQFRLPAVHRLDVAANFHRRVPWGERTITLGLYNAYSRANPAYVDIDRRTARVEPDPRTGLPGYAVTTRVRLVQHGLLPVVPALAYRLRF